MIEVRVGCAVALVGSQVRNIGQYKDRDVRRPLRGYIIKIHVKNIVEIKGWSHVFSQIADSYIIKIYTRSMANQEAINRQFPKHRWFRIIGLSFGYLGGGEFFFAAATINQTDITQRDVFNVVLGNAGNDRGIT